MIANDLCHIKEQDLPHIQTGQRALITIDALDELELEAKISKLIPSGDKKTHAFTVEIRLPAQANLYPGMFGKARFRQE